ncbi:hypothetical protein OROGR_025331 [Orobanche gracilis]
MQIRSPNGNFELQPIRIVSDRYACSSLHCGFHQHDVGSIIVLIGFKARSSFWAKQRHLLITDVFYEQFKYFSRFDFLKKWARSSVEHSAFEAGLVELTGFIIPVNSVQGEFSFFFAKNILRGTPRLNQQIQPILILIHPSSIHIDQVQYCKTSFCIFFSDEPLNNKNPQGSLSPVQ